MEGPVLVAWWIDGQPTSTEAVSYGKRDEEVRKLLDQGWTFLATGPGYAMLRDETRTREAEFIWE